MKPNRGAEFGKVRPAVVLQIEAFNRRLQTVIAAPLTTQLRPEEKALRIEVPPRGRLNQTSYVAVE
ncbi:type II toxin-antitoxin system PemK/MazF family toxin [Hydrocarboniphaga sp.]|uniref:type II toxin-antitoxin system PemK/MazF family toxin n=1 Tax=Hydrocarboniphaga sp. TaxID=2033016 RepID=UPI00262E8D6D|nr:type II toxin-antitoxin system PemK/MazF family toxin [Hydrocarboniphaga sp.]